MSSNLVLHYSAKCPSGCRTPLVKRGFYFCRSQKIQRFLCKGCRKSFCEHILSDVYQEKKPELRRPIFLMLTSGVSQRRLARILKISRLTLTRKFLKLGNLAKILLKEDLLSLPKITSLEFDDLETFCHSKCKPLSVTLAVQKRTRRILGFEVSEMPAKGKLAKIAFKKYGPRHDGRAEARDKLFQTIQPLVAEQALIYSDMNPHYPLDVKKYFPKATHEVFYGRRGCVVGQGELKRGKRDPLFSLNHTCAMLRANINRLFRRTWNTTKLLERLDMHLAIYALFHNRYVIHHKSR